MAEQLIESLSGEFDPTKYHDDYRERVLDLIERKAAGEEIAVQPEAEEPAPAPDLMAALEASLAAVQGGDDAKERRWRRPSRLAKTRKPAKSGSKNGAESKSRAKSRSANCAAGTRW